MYYTVITTPDVTDLVFMPRFRFVLAHCTNRRRPCTSDCSAPNINKNLFLKNSKFNVRLAPHQRMDSDPEPLHRIRIQIQT